jgi:hypothetical protein
MRFIIYNASDTENTYTNDYSNNILITNQTQNHYLNYSFIQENSFNVSSGMNIFQVNKFYAIDVYLKELNEKIFEIKSETGFYGQNCSRDSKWKYSSALLFVYFFF